MIVQRTGPELQRAVEHAEMRAIRGPASRAVIIYRYVDGYGHKKPEYAANFIRIRAYYLYMGTPLEPLADVIKAMHGCHSCTIVQKDPKLRPMVTAIFDRSVPLA